jgi:hypothetical protein
MCRQCDELLAPVVEEGIGGDDEPGSMQFYEGGKGGVDLAFGAGPQVRELHPLRTRRLLHVSSELLGNCTVLVHEQGDYSGLGNQL